MKHLLWIGLLIVLTLVVIMITFSIKGNNIADQRFIEMEFEGTVVEFVSVSRGGILRLENDTPDLGAYGMCLRAEVWPGNKIVKNKGEGLFHVYGTHELHEDIEHWEVPCIDIE